VNCFKNELPEIICGAPQIEVLSLNGLGAAEGCRDTVKFPISGVTLFNTIGGTLPACLWRMRNLSALHVTGNGLTGGLISELPPYSPITDLSLSHNKFSGSIPLGIQRIQRIDLSYNQFSGKYANSLEFWKNSFVNLEINRISGQLPVSKLENVSDLNILKGNMFSCDSIPDNDEHVDNYVCGSESLNESLFVFGSTIVIILLLIMLAVSLVFVSSRSASLNTVFGISFINVQITRLQKYFSFVGELELKQGGVDNLNLLKIIELSENFGKTVKIFIELGFVMFVIVSPIYIIKSADEDNSYATHANTYAWFWTLAYMHGVVPSSLILMSWVVMITVCFYRMILTPSTEAATSTENTLTSSNNIDQYDDAAADANTLKKHGKIIIYLIVNAAVTIVLNVLYIYSTQQPLPVYFHFGIQFSLAVFRLVYSYCVFPILSRPIIDPVANIGFRLRLLLMDNVIIPCFVTLFTSPACFQVHYSIHQPTIYNIIILNDGMMSTGLNCGSRRSEHAIHLSRVCCGASHP
jgi:hypothetical protein